MTATVAHLSVIQGERHASPEPEPDPVMRIVAEECFTLGWNECLAYVLRGDLRPRRPRPACAGSRPGLHVVTG